MTTVFHDRTGKVFFPVYHDIAAILTAAIPLNN